MAPSAIEVKGIRDTEGIPITVPETEISTVNGFTTRRAKAGKFVAGTAAYATSDFFKGPTTGKPKAKRWDRKCLLRCAGKHWRHRADLQRLPQR